MNHRAHVLAVVLTTGSLLLGSSQSLFAQQISIDTAIGEALAQQEVVSEAQPISVGNGLRQVSFGNHTSTGPGQEIQQEQHRVLVGWNAALKYLDLHRLQELVGINEQSLSLYEQALEFRGNQELTHAERTSVEHRALESRQALIFQAEALESSEQAFLTQTGIHATQLSYPEVPAGLPTSAQLIDTSRNLDFQLANANAVALEKRALEVRAQWDARSNTEARSRKPLQFLRSRSATPAQQDTSHLPSVSAAVEAAEAGFASSIQTKLGADNEAYAAWGAIVTAQKNEVGQANYIQELNLMVKEFEGKFSAGTHSLMNLLDVRIAVLRAKEGLVKTRVSRRENEYRLLSSIGRFMEGFKIPEKMDTRMIAAVDHSNPNPAGNASGSGDSVRMTTAVEFSRGISTAGSLPPSGLTPVSRDAAAAVVVSTPNTFDSRESDASSSNAAAESKTEQKRGLRKFLGGFLRKR